jgi:hypothetical protein
LAWRHRKSETKSGESDSTAASVQQLVWGGAFCIGVPSGWRANDEDGRIEVLPKKSAGGAVNFSVMSLGDSYLADEATTRRIVDLLLQSLGATQDEARIAIESGDGECTARGSLPLNEARGIAFDMDILVRAWPGRAVSGTYVRDEQTVQSSWRAQGLSILDSIQLPPTQT